MATSLSREIEVAAPHHQAVERVTEALKQEGFGVLTRVDIHEAFKEKLGVDFREYSILGACNPPLAHRALTASAEVGLLLPCNVTVEASSPSRTTVRIVNPLEMLGAGGAEGNQEIEDVAREAAARLGRVADTLSGTL